MNLVSLFSGAGGLDLGLERAGFIARLANDASSVMATTYRRHWPDVPLHEGSVAELDESRLRGMLGDTFNRIDLLAGGPPCPAFSSARFIQSHHRALADPVAKETIGGFLGVLKSLRPRAFLMENVSGFVFEAHRDALQLVTTTAQNLGYSIEWRVLNAADYGVPQTRRRFFMMGLLGQQPQWPDPTHDRDPGNNLFNQDTVRWVTAGDAIGDLDTDEATDRPAGGRYRSLLREIPPGDNYLYFTKERGYPNPKFEAYSRAGAFLSKMTPDLPSPTILASRSGDNGPFHWSNRQLRIGEVKRLQTFPDDFWVSRGMTWQVRQLGNAVPPTLAEHLGRSLYTQLDNLVSRAL